MTHMERASPRRIKRLLVANRGEIAARILAAANELGIKTYAVSTGDDVTHTFSADHVLKLTSPASYLDIEELLALAGENGIDAVHPGYGFLSENAQFSRRMWERGVQVVGPGWGILEQTGDKLKAKSLAEQHGVPTLPALKEPTSDMEVMRSFAEEVGYPVMIKAIDGGGGRGIRLVRSADQLESGARLAIAESPSKSVFLEKAAMDGYLHVEVQIIGDGSGDVRHLWERQCSIQRRYQKIVEIAPCLTPKRAFISRLIESAVKMAKAIRYFSLGTFEFLANPDTEDYFFLEINPRLQVEHTITEQISGLDLVQAQLLIAQGASLREAGLAGAPREAVSPPKQCSCQLRITAENIRNDFSLSIGKISSFQFPSGNGIRLDTHLVNGVQTIVGSDFDSLLAKLIITAPTWEAVVRKAKRALRDTRIVGVNTNLDALRGIVSHPDFASRDCDTSWLERNHSSLEQAGEHVINSLTASLIPNTSTSNTNFSTGQSTLFRKGDAWTITLAEKGKIEAENHHMQISRVLRNEFPTSLTADILYATNASTGPVPFTMTLTSTSSSASAATARHRKGDPRDPSHVLIPFPGTLIEVLVDVGDAVCEGDVICVVRQMKMELEVRAAKAGTVSWILEVEEGEEVAEGTLAAEVVVQKHVNVTAKASQSKL